MKNFKKWFIAVICAFITLILLTAAFVVYIDPFFIYHKPHENLAYPVVYESQLYYDAGMIKSFDYDSIIVGSSMTENFKASWFDELMGLKTIKTPCGGAKTRDIYIILRSALESGRKIDRAFVCLDYWMLEESHTESRAEEVSYLFDNNVFNDVKYIFNKDTVFSSCADVLSYTASGNKTDVDSANTWGDVRVFSKENTLNSFVQSEKTDAAPDIDNYLKAAKLNIETNILPLVEQYPQTRFTFFFPPYSMLLWYNKTLENNVDATLTELEYVIGTLLEYDNCEVYWFYDLNEVTKNLNNYTDLQHYSPSINRYLAECFANGEHKLGENDYRSVVQKMREYALNFDYSVLFE